jgi:hypothetical protein
LQITINSANFTEGKTKIRISNLVGQKLLELSAHKKELLSLRNFSNGMYLVEVSANDKVWKRKIVVNH